MAIEAISQLHHHAEIRRLEVQDASMPWSKISANGFELRELGTWAVPEMIRRSYMPRVCIRHASSSKANLRQMPHIAASVPLRQTLDQ